MQKEGLAMQLRMTNKTVESSSNRNQGEKSVAQVIRNIRNRRIVFIREQLRSEENFLIQMEEQEEVIYMKPDCADDVMVEMTRIACSEDSSELQSIEYHNRAAQLLEFYTLNQQSIFISRIQVQYTTVLFAKINYAISLKKYQLPDEVISLLVECDQILKIKGKSLKRSQQDQLTLAKLVQNKLLRLRIIFQCTLLFSETRRNKQALELAKGALKILRTIFNITIRLCQNNNLSNKKQRANSEMHSPTHGVQSNLSYAQIVETVFKEVLQLIKFVMPPQEVDKYQENLLLRQHQSRSQSVDKCDQVFFQQPKAKLYPLIDDNHPILQLQILGLMQLNQVDLEELFPISSQDMVLAEEVILELIMLAGLSFYSISTEMRFINQNTGAGSYDNRQNLEIWLCKALEVYYTFVPHSSQILNQIHQVYKKLYGVDKQSIPEDQEITHTTKLLRPHPYNNKATLSHVIIIKVPQELQVQQNNKTSKTNPSTNSNKQLQRHLLTQMEEEPPRQQLFIRKQPEPRLRVDSLMNQILTLQVKNNKIQIRTNAPLVKKYNLYAQKSSAPNIQQQQDNLRSLSNSRKQSQPNISKPELPKSQIKYRYRNSSTLENDKFSQHIANVVKQQQLVTQSLQRKPESQLRAKLLYQNMLRQKA